MPHRARGGDPEERDGLLGYRHSAGAGDQVGGIGGGGEVHERLGSLGERGAVTDDEVEVALDGVAASYMTYFCFRLYFLPLFLSIILLSLVQLCYNLENTPKEMF